MDLSYCVTSISFNVFKFSISSFHCSEINCQMSSLVTIESGILHIDKDLAMLSSLFYTLTISTVVIIEVGIAAISLFSRMVVLKHSENTAQFEPDTSNLGIDEGTHHSQ